MSWDAYVDSLIGYSGGESQCDKGCIVGLDGSLWTTSGTPKNISPTASEISAVASAMNSGNYGDFQANGVTLQGVKYRFLRESDGAVYCKQRGEGNIALMKTTRGVVIGHAPEGAQPGNLNSGIAKLVEYVKSTGY